MTTSPSTQAKAEAAEGLEQQNRVLVEVKSPEEIRISTNNISSTQRQWLENLKPELETMTVLYAKSIWFGLEQHNKTMLGVNEKQQQQKHGFIRLPINGDRPTAIVSDLQQQKIGREKQHSPTIHSRLHVTRIDRMDAQSNQIGNDNSTTNPEATAVADDSSIYCSTVCILPAQRKTSTGKIVIDIATKTDDDKSNVAAQLLVMCRLSRVEIHPATSRRGPTTKITDTTTSTSICDWPAPEQMSLTKFAHSLPNGSGLCEQFYNEANAENGNETAANKHEECAENSGSIEFFNPASVASTTAASTHIYRPNIRYRRMCPSNRDRQRIGLSSSMHQSINNNNLPLIVRPVAFRHSIRVDNEQFQRKIKNDASSSPQANSTDSGQCSSGDSPPYCEYSTIAADKISWHDQRRRCTTSSSETGSSSGTAHERIATALINGTDEYMQQHLHKKQMLPSYARTANTIDQALRLSSFIFTQLSSCASNASYKLINSIHAFIRFMEQCPCAYAMPHSQIELVRRALIDVETNLEEHAARNSKTASTTAMTMFNDYLAVCVRQMLECSMIVFVKVICQYLDQCANHDRLLLIGLEHLVHLLLFGDELCVEAVRLKAVDNLLALCLMPLTPADTLKLLLRTLAVICGTTKGCLQLLSIGGLDFILRVLCESEIMDCSFEAAGCLAQLCSPAHSLVRPSVQPLVPRLLQLVDKAYLPESLLLCFAALANLGTQCQGPVSELLYVNNAIVRLIRSAQRPKCTANLYVQEQLVTILTRMANRGYERALMAQGAVPILCKMLIPLQLSSNHSEIRQVELQKRIAYKAAVCLGSLASTGSGLRGMHEQGVYQVLLQMSRPENKQKTMTPVQLICTSIKQKLENTYHQLETAV